MADTVDPGAPDNDELKGEEEGVVAARQRFQRLGDEVQNRYRKVSDDVRRGAERASQEVRRGAERARETARETYGEVSETAQRSYERVRSEAGNLSREVSLFVRDNPGKAVLIAAGVGFLLGLLTRGRGGDEEE
ncbi:MAG TPA: DUF883 C-terminal domain-containing protein [Thermoanaerobaculia bacterium]|jgi:ElaB/YqjD/DUF883 family membrane-anchored ribosome-binding protein